MNEKNPLEIEHLIPHRGPMRLIDRVLRADGNRLETLSVVEKTWPLCSIRGVDVIVAIEVIAQAAAALHGYRKGWQDEPKVGLLVGVKDARFYRRHLPMKAKLTGRVAVLSLKRSFCVFEGELMLGEELICRAVVQAVEPENQFFQKLIKNNSGSIQDS
ncbi:MAG: hypothetical protein JW950_08970 [Deltaproteobacteria bacterium]|nr:hypothetical protein [Deltaproteobacteria bacterium]